MHDQEGVGFTDQHGGPSRGCTIPRVNGCVIHCIDKLTALCVETRGGGCDTGRSALYFRQGGGIAAIIACAQCIVPTNHGFIGRCLVGLVPNAADASFCRWDLSYTVGGVCVHSLHPLLGGKRRRTWRSAEALNLDPYQRAHRMGEA
jgi:hypothetical protein